MGSYIPSTKAQQLEMLKEAGFSSFEELYKDIDPSLLFQGELHLPDGKSELEVQRYLKQIASKNHIYQHIFRGAGAYQHYIPSIVTSVLSKEEFITAYTPYQAEISQGVLQSIFEYQTMICELTGMDVSNASVYDGAVAAAEAIAMCTSPKNKKIYVSEGIHPEVCKVIQTYCWANQNEIVFLPLKDGKTDYSLLKDADGCCVYIQQQNFYGVIEDAKEIGVLAHEKNMKYIMGVEPFAMCLLPTPKECGADIAVGEGQPLGMPLSFGGPYLGFMATTSKLMRSLPGRIVGETIDHDGRKAYVLTLQAREQHIRREKASSNICSNEALCAMTAAVYLSALGPKGMQEAAKQCYSKAHYLAKKLEENGHPLKYSHDFFNEFVTVCDHPEEVLKALEEKNILGGLPVSGGILWCVTEIHTKEDMDMLVKEVAR